ncbi:hypothetical protein G3A43_07080 [Paraburkholderia aspalathi]|nr:hypothetical protein [Paraburkholderia aspalathi]MBK3780015.1 hypothetical protein [Paraburkholderia aspalathi]
MNTQQVKLRLTLDVDYASTDVPAEELQSHLRSATERAIGGGLLSGRGDVVVDEHWMDVIVVGDGLPESVQMFKDSLEQNRSLLDGLVAAYGEVLTRGPAPGLEAFIREHVDGLEIDLCARAANACTDDEDAQEAAICAVETWLTENVRADTASRLGAVLWVKGVYAGAVEILRWLQ